VSGGNAPKEATESAPVSVQVPAKQEQPSAPRQVQALAGAAARSDVPSKSPLIILILLALLLVIIIAFFLSREKELPSAFTAPVETSLKKKAQHRRKKK